MRHRPNPRRSPADGGATAVNVFFDVDCTIVDADERLRPGVRELFEDLHAAGHAIYLWSGLGARWEIVRAHGLDALVRACFTKPLYQYERMLAPLGIDIHPDWVVDDHPHLVAAFGGSVVAPYTGPNEHDAEMERVGRAIGTARTRALHTTK
jgi:hypothetical protein